MAKKHIKQFAVIGLGRFGAALARQLYEDGAEVLAIDSEQDAVNEIHDFCTQAVCLDATDPNALKAIGIRNFDTVIVSIGAAESSIFITLICKELGVKSVLAKAGSRRHKAVLEKIGADYVVFPEEYMGRKTAAMLTNPNIMEIAELTPDFRIIEFITPEKWTQKTLLELNLVKNYGISVLIIKRGNEVISCVRADTVLLPQDILVVCGADDDIDKLEKVATQAINEFMD